jgi:dipeptidyl-peptidase-4
MKLLWIPIILQIITLGLHSQGTLEDYRRYHEYGSNFGGKVFYDKVNANWFVDGSGFWYRREEPGKKVSFIVVDAAKGVREVAFDPARLAMEIGKNLNKVVDAGQLRITDIQLIDEKELYVTAQEAGWLVNRICGSVDKREAPPKTQPVPKWKANQDGSKRGNKSPDGKWEVRIEDNKVAIRRVDGGEVRQLKTAISDERRVQDGVFWAPDSQHFVVLSENIVEQRKVHVVESSPKDQVQPRLHEFGYTKPGDDIRMLRPHLFLVGCGELELDTSLFPTPWQIRHIRWSSDSRRFTFYYNQRGHQVVRMVGVDGKTGTASALVEETPDTFVDYAYKTLMHWVGEDEMIWMSERDGWNHLYLYDMKSGQVKNQITRGNWVVRGVDWIDDEKRQIGFRAMGIDANQDPYHVHHCRINFDGTNLIRLTKGDGMHEITYSPDRKYYLDRYTRIDMAGITELRRSSDGKKLCTIESADISELQKAGWQAPERFVAKGRDGKTDIYGLIFKPSRMDPQRKYPVIERIYAGPHGHHVPKIFGTNWYSHRMAEIGFILVQIDGMGTNWRSKAFHDVCWQNLGDAGFPDRIAWMKAAAKDRPYMDLERVGIFGGSAGGQNTLGGMLQYPDFYKAGAADCGCHDNRMDKIWWNEAWMGWPIGPHYARQSNVTMAHQLKGKLLLTVGEMDKNVDPASTMQVVNALIQANKDFELVVFPGGGHGIGESPYGKRRRNDFFVRHLLGVAPPPIEQRK